MTQMVTIPGGTFTMGSDRFYPEEAPMHLGHVDAFRIAAAPVTNAEFAEFVAETGYVTIAERELSREQFAHLSEAERAAGSLCFTPTAGPVDLRNWRQWWRWQTGASWRHPDGPQSSIDGRGDHPVVQVCYVDALAYADWAGMRLPTEAEWERAARGGIDGREYAWGDELMPGGELRANTFQGEFPYANTGAAGWVGTSPVGTFGPNEYGLVDVIGNVWEWTQTTATPNHRTRPDSVPAAPTPAPGEAASTPGTSACACGPAAPQRSPNPAINRVTKGGSHLCAPSYCQRYRPAARSPQSEDSATTHLGFRLAADL